MLFERNVAYEAHIFHDSLLLPHLNLLILFILTAITKPQLLTFSSSARIQNRSSEGVVLFS